MASEGSCTEKGCTVASDGRCLEGLPLTECPHFRDDGKGPPLQEHVGDSEGEPDVGAQSAHENLFALSTGESLDSSQILQVTARGAIASIALLGFREAGKTTLISQTYEQFVLGENPQNLRFVDSETLFAFEEKAHLARIACGGDMPRTERTSVRDGVHYLHLCIRDIEANEKLSNLLFVDLSGELVKNAAESQHSAKSLTFLPYTSVTAFVLDGEQLRNKSLRQAHFAKLRSLVVNIASSGMFPSQAHIQILVTKFELIDQNDLPWIEDHLNRTAQEIKKIGNTEKEVTTKLVSIFGDEERGIQRYHGLANLLDEWLSPPPNKQSREFIRFNPKSEFDRYALSLD